MKSTMLQQISISGPRVTRARVCRPSRRCCPVVRASLVAEKPLDINTMEPLGTRVLLKPMKNEPKSEGGILLPTSATQTQDSAKFGEVIAVGEASELNLKKGDKVIFASESVANVDVPDGEIIFVSDKSIMATMA